MVHNCAETQKSGRMWESSPKAFIRVRRLKERRDRLKRITLSRALTYGLRELRTVCPWCKADGSAHEKFGVEFTDRASIGGGD
jgi:hypothetical protein